MKARLDHWRSLEEYADSPECREWLEREFAPMASEWEDAVSRRRFLKLMGASLALAGLGACTRQPLEKIVPYVTQPVGMVPGEPLHFATSLTLGGFARGALIESREGRPVKVEGNPAHPASLGGTDVFMQAATLDLYDPGRAKTVTHAGAIVTWNDFRTALAGELARLANQGGAGIRVLTGNVTSPTLGAQMRALLAKYPGAKWHVWEPLNRDAARAGAELAFGVPLDVVCDFEKADLVVSLDADFLGTGPAQPRYVRDFAKRRRVAEGVENLNRLYVAEPTPSITGARADHRIPTAPGVLSQIAEALGTELGVISKQLDAAYDSAFVTAAAADLLAHRGRSLVLAGESQPAHIHAFAHQMNAALGNVGETVRLIAPVDENPVNRTASLRELVGDLESGKVELLVVLGGNPAFDAPADFAFAEKMLRAKTCVFLGTHPNETAAACDWQIPAAHELESWSDARAFDGTAGIVQPLIEPLYTGAVTPHEFIAAMLGEAVPSSYEIVRDFWREQKVWEDFEAGWEKAVRGGAIADTAFASKPAEARTITPETKATPKGLTLLFRADPTIHDGTFSGSTWLQELPKPLTKLVWDNAVLISPRTAARLGLTTNDLVELTNAARQVVAAIFLIPGQADDTLTLHLGYGRRIGNATATGHGFDAYPLRMSTAMDSTEVTLRKTGETYPLITTQQHFGLEGRNLLRVATLSELRDKPTVIQDMGKIPAPDETLYNPHEFPSKHYAWALTIDLSTCVGCNACVVACQSENNIPVVGKEEVQRGREMHWIRVDTYFAGVPENPGTHFQPVPCMHCENAPCEVVCPVAATLHDSDGLNVQVYNRCVGTRYCSNNCPYKVRRFNFLEYNGGISPVEKLGKNPEVSVRSRGVMEKCSYCIQRIESARTTAAIEERRVRDGEITPACAQACPAEAITFGDLNDSTSRVVKLKATKLNYGMLAELNTRPRTTYLGRITNPQPEARA